MIDSGVATNIMLVDVMKELGLNVNTPYGKFSAMDNRYVLVVGIIKSIQFRFHSCSDVSYKMDIIVVEILAYYGMFLSRKWPNFDPRASWFNKESCIIQKKLLFSIPIHFLRSNHFFLHPLFVHTWNLKGDLKHITSLSSHNLIH